LVETSTAKKDEGKAKKARKEHGSHVQVGPQNPGDHIKAPVREHHEKRGGTRARKKEKRKTQSKKKKIE